MTPLLESMKKKDGTFERTSKRIAKHLIDRLDEVATKQAQKKNVVYRQSGSKGPTFQITRKRNQSIGKCYGRKVKEDYSTQGAP